MKAPLLGSAAKGLLVCLCIVTAQAGEALPTEFRKELPDLPTYPTDGILRGHNLKSFIFLDVDKKHLVTSFPKSSGLDFTPPPENTPAPDDRFTQLIPLAVACAPQLTVEVSNVGERHVVAYTYRLGNLLSAENAIASLKVTVPSRENVTTVPATGWFAPARPPQLSDEAIARHREMIIGPWGEQQEQRVNRWPIPAAAHWYVQSGTAGDPGAKPTVLRAESVLLPGLTRAYVSCLPGSIAVNAPMPEYIKKDLYAFNAEQNNSLSSVTIGPRFDDSTPVREVARETLKSVETMCEEGELRSDSEFVRSATTMLEGIIKGDRRAFDEVPTPGTPAEMSVAAVIKFHFRQRPHGRKAGGY